MTESKSLRALREFLLLTLTVVAVGFLLLLLWQWVVGA